MSPLAKTVVRAVKGIVLSGSSRFVQCNQHRISCEGWLKVELIHTLASVKGVSVHPEFNKTDLVVRGAGEACLIELKTFPTNYGRTETHRGVKPITNFIAGVANDLRKLAGKRTSNESGISIWLAYPIPENRRDKWAASILPIQQETDQVLWEETIALGEQKHVHIYVFQSK